MGPSCLYRRHQPLLPSLTPGHSGQLCPRARVSPSPASSSPAGAAPGGGGLTPLGWARSLEPVGGWVQNHTMQVPLTSTEHGSQGGHRVSGGVLGSRVRAQPHSLFRDRIAHPLSPRHGQEATGTRQEKRVQWAQAGSRGRAAPRCPTSCSIACFDVVLTGGALGSV